jgi:hypothetical protein
MKKLFFILPFLFFSTMSFAGENSDAMDMQLKSNINELIEWSKNSIYKTNDFAQEQMPLVVQEFLSWTFYSNMMCGIATTSLFMIFLSIGIYNYRVEIKKEDAWDELNPNIFLTLVSLFLVVFIFITPLFRNCMYGSFEQAIKCKIAPRIVVIEKIGELVK